MQTHKLGDTDMHITSIGLGTWAIGGPGWEAAAHPNSIKLSGPPISS